MSAQSIRSVAIAMFAEQLPNRTKHEDAAAQRKSDVAWRKNILVTLIEQTGCTMAAASTHYNEAKKTATAATPELVVGLGRPEDKNNGGRKKKIALAAEPVQEAAGETQQTAAEPVQEPAAQVDEPAADADEQAPADETQEAQTAE